MKWLSYSITVMNCIPPPPVCKKVWWRNLPLQLAPETLTKLSGHALVHQLPSLTQTLMVFSCTLSICSVWKLLIPGGWKTTVPRERGRTGRAVCFTLSTTLLPRQEGQPGFNNFLQPKSVKVKPGAVLVERQAQGSLCLKGRVASLFTQPNIQLPFSLPWLGLSSLCPGLLPAGLNQQGSVGTLGQPLSMNLTQASCPLVNGERALRF